MLESASFRLSLIVVEWSGQLSGIFIGNNSCDVTIGVIVPSGKRLQFFFCTFFASFNPGLTYIAVVRQVMHRRDIKLKLCSFLVCLELLLV